MQRGDATCAIEAPAPFHRDRRVALDKFSNRYVEVIPWAFIRERSM